MLRDFRREDQRAVRKLVLDGLRERWGQAFDPAFNPDLEDILTNYVRRGADVVVVEQNGEVVAAGMLLLEHGVGRIVRMSVAKGVRRRGIGRLVVGELVSRAATKGLTEVRVMTDRPWRSAVELYLSCGFSEVLDNGDDKHFVLRM